MPTILQNNGEVINQPLYDSGLYPAAGGISPIKLFQNVAGQGLTAFGSGVGVSAKTDRDTNMVAAGQIPDGYAMDVYAISIVWGAETPTLPIDLVKCIMGSYLVLTVASKPQLKLPAIKFTAGCGITGLAATAVGGVPLEMHAGQNGIADPRSVYGLSDIIGIPAKMNFDVVMSWPSIGVAVTSAIPFTVYLEGRQGRPIQ